MNTPDMKEYLARNLLVCKAVGATAGANAALKRLRQMKRPAQWLIASFESIAERTAPLAKPLAEYRNQVKP